MKKEVNKPFGIDTSLFKRDKLDGKYRETWIEESLYFENNVGKQISTPQTTYHLGSSFSNKKVKLFFIFLLIIFSLILSRFFYLQIIMGANYRQAAESNRQRIIPIPAERGLIYDRQSIQLTKNIPNFTLTLVPQDLPRRQSEREPIIKRLSELIGKSEEDIRAILEEYGIYSYESIIIQENINYDTALTILIETGNLPGIQIQRGSKRLYLTDFGKEFSTSTPNSFSHILGYIGKLNPEELTEFYKQGYLPSDSIGKTGIEKSYESFLRGTYGKKRVEVNADGREQTVLAEQAPTPGFHLELAIDATMQAKLEEIIVHHLKLQNKKRAAAVVINPNTGEILSLVSWPAFDNNDFSGGISNARYQTYIENTNKPLFNRVLSGTYPSGSTIKPAIGAAALQEGIINSATSFLSVGGIQIRQWFFPDWLAGGHGQTNIRQALAWSVNTFFYYIGGGFENFVGLGVDKINSYLHEFGFAEKLGIDLPGEASGFLPSKKWKENTKQERWYIGDTYNFSIGQGDLLVTPLQIASMTAVIANGGLLYKPYVVKAVIDPLTGDRQEVEPKILNSDFIHPSHINTIRWGMRDCVDYGSCSRLSLLPFSSAGKTGTAQWSSTKPNHAWYTSFAPFNDPKIVVTILVEEGEGGGTISVPIAYDFYNWWWGYIHN